MPELVAEFAALHHRFGRDETYVSAAVDAVDHNAVLLGETIARLTKVENKLNGAEAVVTQHKADATANAVALDLQLRTELNTVTTRLGDEIRTDLTKVQESFDILKGITLGAAAAARTTATASPPGFSGSDAMEAAFTLLDSRTTQLSALRHSPRHDCRPHPSRCTSQRAPASSPRPAQQLCCECGRRGCFLGSSWWNCTRWIRMAARRHEGRRDRLP